MNILIFADSHGRTLGMYDAIEREKPDAVIHLGDYAEDARELARAYPHLPLYAVRGNNDYGCELPQYSVIAPDNVPLFLTHGHRERVSMLGCGVVPQRAREEGSGFAFFGHTHRQMLERIDGVVVCNPGSISLPRGGRPGYARLTIEEHRVRALALLEEDGALVRIEEFQ